MSENIKSYKSDQSANGFADWFLLRKYNFQFFNNFHNFWPERPTALILREIQDYPVLRLTVALANNFNGSASQQSTGIHLRKYSVCCTSGWSGLEYIDIDGGTTDGSVENNQSYEQ